MIFNHYEILLSRSMIFLPCNSKTRLTVSLKTKILKTKILIMSFLVRIEKNMLPYTFSYDQLLYQQTADWCIFIAESESWCLLNLSRRYVDINCCFLPALLVLVNKNLVYYAFLGARKTERRERCAARQAIVLHIFNLILGRPRNYGTEDSSDKWSNAKYRQTAVPFNSTTISLLWLF